MEILKKSLKAYAIALGLFLVLSFVLAALLNFTGFKESWTFGGLIVALTAAALLLGILEAKVIGKKGLFVGLASALLFLLMILFSAGGIFMDSFGLQSFKALYIVPILAGGGGGILGANSSK